MSLFLVELLWPIADLNPLFGTSRMKVYTLALHIHLHFGMSSLQAMWHLAQARSWEQKALNWTLQTLGSEGDVVAIKHRSSVDKEKPHTRVCLLPLWLDQPCPDVIQYLEYLCEITFIFPMQRGV